MSAAEQRPAPEPAPVMDRETARFVAARLGAGIDPDAASQILHQGYDRWLDRQLSPPPGEEARVTSRLAALSLPIKYGANDKKPGAGWPATDEVRPLRLLDQPIERLWPLLDRDTTADQERRRALTEVIVATLVRRQETAYPLREVMVEFWHDHFQVDAWDNDRVTVAFPAYDRDVIRPRAFGNFRDLLEAVATSTAMLFYLSNQASRAGAANENYARELFELHTLGAAAYLNDKYDRWRDVPGAVNGHPAGYIDQDVYEAARAFTGWSVEDGAGLDGKRTLPRTGRFVYIETWHDGYQKRVLGTEFAAFQPAQADGRKVLDMVAAHPATARFLAEKLVRRLVADDPPPGLVAAAAATWTRASAQPDQIAQVVRTILLSPEFLRARGLKARRPAMLTVDFARAVGLDLAPTEPLINAIASAGQRMFGFATPNGPPDIATPYLAAAALRQRWSIPLALADNRWATGLPKPSSQVPRLPIAAHDAARFWLGRFGGRSDEATVAALLRAGGTAPDLGLATAPDDERRHAKLAALAAMSPAFQMT